MIRTLLPAALISLAVGTLSSCFSLPFKSHPDGQADPNQQMRPLEPQPSPQQPAQPVAQANAFYETGAASTSFFVSRPETERTDRLPDKILRRATVVQVLVPDAGAGWSKVKLVDAQTGYVPLEDLDIVSRDVRPTGFPRNGSGIDTRGSLELPDPPTAAPPSAPGNDSIRFDDLESPLSSPDVPSVPAVPDTSTPTENISIDSLPGS